MKFFKYLIVIFFIVEIACFALVGRLIGVWPTVALVIITSLFGLYLIRRNGMGKMMQAVQNMQAGGGPPPKMPNAFLIFSGFLLLIPGFVTDLLGLLLLLPFVQNMIKRKAGSSRWAAGMAGGMHSQIFSQMRVGGANGDSIIEGEVVAKNDSE